MRFVPLAERCGINLNDSTLDKGVGSNELVIGGVVHLNLQVTMGNSSIVTRRTHTTPISLVLRVTCSEAHAKFPLSRRRARCFKFPPRTRTVWMRLGPSLVLAG